MIFASLQDFRHCIMQCTSLECLEQSHVNSKSSMDACSSINPGDSSRPKTVSHKSFTNLSHFFLVSPYLNLIRGCSQIVSYLNHLHLIHYMFSEYEVYCMYYNKYHMKNYKLLCSSSHRAYSCIDSSQHAIKYRNSCRLTNDDTCQECKARIQRGRLSLSGVVKDNLFGMTFKHEHERSEKLILYRRKNSSHKELQD